MEKWIPATRLSAQIVRSLNVIRGQKRSPHLHFNGWEASIRWPSNHTNYTPEIVCRGRWNRHEIMLFLEKLPDLSIFDEALRGTSWEQLDEELRPLFFEVFLRTALEPLTTVLPGTISLDSLSLIRSSSDPDSGTYPLFFCATVSSVESLRGHWVLSEEAWGDLARQYSSEPSPLSIDEPPWDQIPVPFRWQIGCTRCDVRLLATLAQNDILLMDNDSWFKGGHFFLIHRRFCFAAFLEGSYVRLERFMEQGEGDEGLPVGIVPTEGEEGTDTIPETVPEGIEGMEVDPSTVVPETESSAPVEQKLPVERLPVEVTFDLGSKTFPLAEVNHLAPGFTFELDRSLESPVDIRVNGTKIASGELVAIDDRLGVRILSFHANNG
jgi:type III secretion system YscQ/HrcQ family protein